MSAIGPLGGAGGSPASVEQIIALRQQLVERSRAIQDLQATRTQAPAEPAGPAGSSFGASLTQALEGVNAAQSRSSELTAAYERGDVTDIAKVMLARQEAGVAFEATLQVRNKLLSAYQETMRMGI